MARTANVMTRIEPQIKEQAEMVLAQLGISMSAAMEMYLRQIALQRKIPFEVKLPLAEPICYGSLSDDEFNALMDKAATSYASGLCVKVEDFEEMLKKELNV
ncbi:MAG: type II toxin-antitoxin system RelB/DinJ family antitoxin [Clostridia bacterium]|nr:type II toxin-antitoxin system RelB/DinJ family antitoxin [Clostridia bacterium]